MPVRDLRALRPFLLTVAVFVLVSTWSWSQHDWLRERWLGLLLESLGGTRAEIVVQDPDAFPLKLRLAVLTAALGTFPVLQAEGWRHICRLARSERALRFTLPFAACATAAALLVLWMTLTLFTPVQILL